jgi:aspartyl-tRNA(Asn)/glutamyl-tRNA(Gln) amidotransferase subunit A
MLPGLLLDFDCIGPVARSVADAKLLFEAVRGPAAVDRASLAAAWAAAQPQPMAPLRMLYAERLHGNPLDARIAESCRGAVQRLAALGHHVEHGELPLDLSFLLEAWPQIGQVGLAAAFDEHPDWQAQASPRYRELAEAGRRVPGTRVWQIAARVARLRRDCAALFERIDVIVMPAAAALPWPAAEPYPGVIDGQVVGPRGHAVYTGWVNAAGLPGLALPAAAAPDGLPIGIQLVGAYGSDDLLLELGAAYEAREPWTDRWPPL